MYNSANQLAVENGGQIIPVGTLLSLVGMGKINPEAVAYLEPIVAAELTIQDLTYIAVQKGPSGNSISIQYVTGVGSSTTASVLGNAITVTFPAAGSDTALNVASAVGAVAGALVSVKVNNPAGTETSPVAATDLSGGLSVTQPPVGISISTIPANSSGLLVTSGPVCDINTQGLVEGTLLYAGVNGSLVTTIPGSGYTAPVAMVLTSDPKFGCIFVYPLAG